MHIISAGWKEPSLMRLWPWYWLETWSIATVNRLKTGKPAMASTSEEARRYCERIEKRAGRSEANWAYLWPIALAPSIPLLGMALRNKPHIRNYVMGGWSGALLIWAATTSLAGPPTGAESGWRWAAQSPPPLISHRDYTHNTYSNLSNQDCSNSICPKCVS